MALERLQKILARAGVASRRACEQIIDQGRVSLDGRPVTTPGVKADPSVQDVRLDGRRLRPERLEYWLLNKPQGVLCTSADPAGRRRAVDLVPRARARLFPVGRLDADSRGLLLLTNDGDLANRIAHPSHGVPKTYLATVSGRLCGEDIRKLLRGVHLAEGRARAAKARILKRGTTRSLVEITLREGKNRQVRRVLAKLGHPVRELVRTRLGRISLRGLGVGRARPLDPKEIQYLQRLASADPDQQMVLAGPPPKKKSDKNAPRRKPDRPSRPPGPNRRPRNRTRHDRKQA